MYIYYIYICIYICVYIYIYIYIYLLYKCQIYINNSRRHFFKISDISNLTNLQRTVANKKCKKVYTN